MVEDVTQREAVAGYLSSRNWGNRHPRMGGPRGFWLAEADALLAALSALEPVQPTVECDTCHGSGVLGDDTCPGGCDRGARLAPVRPDPLRVGVQVLAGDLGCEEFDGTLDLDGLRALDRLRALLAETEVHRGDG